MVAAGNTGPEAWIRAFDARSDAAFGEALAKDVQLDASVMRRPVRGRHDVAAVLAAAASLYDSLTFTRRFTDGNVAYAEWHAEACGSTKMAGVTVLTHDDTGRVTHAAIHHRPVGAVVAFAEALAERLRGVVDPECLYDAGGADAPADSPVGAPAEAPTDAPLDSATGSPAQ